MKKIILRGIEAREKFKKGVDFCADIVKSTLGPYGRNVVIEWVGKWPVITNDGVTIAKSIEVGDETENLAVLTLVNAAHKTNGMVGDGTTSTIVIAQKIIEETFKKIDEQKSSLIGDTFNVHKIYREINEWKDKIIEELDKISKPIEDLQELESVAITAVENEKIGKMIAQMVWTIGKDGFVSVEDSYGYEIEDEVVVGMHIFGRYIADYMANEKREAVLENTFVLVTNQDIEDGLELLRKAGTSEGIIKDLIEGGQKSLVIIGPKFGKGAILQFWLAKNTGFKILALKTPALTTDQYEDIAIYTGARFIDTSKGGLVDKISLQDLGRIDKIVAKTEKAAIIGGKGDKEKILGRVMALKQQLEVEEDDLFQKKLKQRIASLSGGIGVIRVGSVTDIEKGYLKHKIEDSVNAVKAALEDGVVKGGGLALKEVAEKLEENILTSAIKAPYEQIQTNAGGKLEISENIFDPTKVVKTEIINAVSVAGTILTIEATIATKKKSLLEELTAQIDTRAPSRIPPRDEEKYEI